MAAPKLALSFALAWVLLAGLFLTGEATNSRCKQKQVRERKPTIETLHWQEACLPLAVIVGGCCGLVWWFLVITYDVSQKGGQKGLPQISGEAEMEEQKTTALDHLDEWTEAGIKLDYTADGKGNVSPQTKSGPCPPSQPKQQDHTTVWTFLERELENILLTVRHHRTTGQNPVAEEQGTHFSRGPQGPLATGQADTLPSPPLQENISPVEKPSPVMVDWQSLLDHIKKYCLTTEGQKFSALEKQCPLPEGQSSPADQERPPSKERQKSRSKGRKKSSNRSKSRSKERKKSPNRTRNRSKKRSTTKKRSRSRCRPCSKA